MRICVNVDYWGKSESKVFLKDTDQFEISQSSNRSFFTYKFYINLILKIEFI